MLAICLSSFYVFDYDGHQPYQYLVVDTLLILKI